MPGQTHPELYDRLLAAGVQPAFPRPEAPWWILSRLAGLATFLSMIALGIIWALVLKVWKL